jgi:hypothetical protein
LTLHRARGGWPPLRAFSIPYNESKIGPFSLRSDAGLFFPAK